MSAPICRTGDAIDHEGTVIEGSPNVFADGLAVARIGDKVLCALHGEQIIVTGSERVFTNGKGVARVGDEVSCGAVLVEGSPGVSVG